MLSPQWTDAELKAKMREYHPKQWNEMGGELAFAVLAELRDEMLATITGLEVELENVLDTAIARGEEWNYDDKEYRERYEQLAGHRWDEPRKPIDA